MKMEQKVNDSVQDYQDMFSGLSLDVLKNIFIRFYTMEQYFELKQQDLGPAQSMQNQVKKTMVICTYYNKIIQQCIFDLYIMNKLISSQAKVVNSLLENGRSISEKKASTWGQFLQEKGHQQVKKVFGLLSSPRKCVIKYLVSSLSNLLLKLSINMSKVSIIPIQKFINFQCLNVTTLSVVYLQFMQYKLFLSKNIKQQNNRVNFLKLLPKITFIKLNKFKNNTDMQLLQNSQKQFIDKQVENQTIRNLQYIEIYEQSDRLYPNYQLPQNSCEHMYSLGLDGIKSPFTFQILQLMRQIVFPLVKDFKPDLIIYMESYPCGVEVMHDETRGLMLCEMAEETCCNKMYVFKELGPDKFNLQNYQKLIKQNSQMMSNQNNQVSYEFMNQEKLPDFNKVFETAQTELMPKQVPKVLKMASQDKYKKEQMQIQRIKKVFMNEMCYTSLALIQKTSFENIYAASNKHFFKKQFLIWMIKWLQKLIHKAKPVQKQNVIHNHLFFILSQNKKKIEMMLQVLKINQNGDMQNGQYKIIDLTFQPSAYSQFYNILTNKVQKLQIEQENPMTFSDKDNFIAKYYEQQKRVLLFIIKNIQKLKAVSLVILIKQKEMKKFIKLKDLKFSSIQNNLEGATYICSNDYLYRGFGRFKQPQKNNEYNRAIHRIQLYPQIGSEWQLFSQFAILKNEAQKEQKLPFEQKIQGYGIYDSDSKSVMFMGGYMDSYNEQKISKNIYFIKKADKQDPTKPQKIVNMMGKTNKLLYNANGGMKNFFLNPFVFGIPFYFGGSSIQKCNALVLNSNGYYLNLNHSNKIFVSLMKLSQTLIYNGINCQSKLKISNKAEQASLAIFLSEVLIKVLVQYPQQINTYKNYCAITTMEQGLILIQAGLKKNGEQKGEQKGLRVKAKQIFEDDEWRQIQFI